MGREDR
jgi:hypothetical protein